MPYMIETWDKPDHQQLRKQTRDEHLHYLATHAIAGLRRQAQR